MPILSCRRGGSQIGRTQHQVSNITTLQTYIWPQQQTDLKIMSDLLLLLLDWLLLSDPFLVLPFGYGPRGCIGRKLAEDSLLLLIIHLFARFRFCQLFYNRSSNWSAASEFNPRNYEQVKSSPAPVSYPTRWSMLFVFGFLWWSSKYSTAMY